VIRRSIRYLAAASIVACVLWPGAPASASARKTVTLYAVPASAQFMNHADDRLRGMTTNPFNVSTEALVIVTKGSEKKAGPFPGDDVLYSFKLYKDAKAQHPAGSAMFTCYYNFAKRALCDSYLELDRGLVLASGPVTFDAKRFVLSVTGGTGPYLGALGQVNAAPTASNAERLDLVLNGLAR
jgi:hypothetical protein